MRETTHEENMLGRSITCKRNEKGFPLDDDGNIDWELTSWEKSKFEPKENRADGINKKPKRKHGTNYTPPKKKRKK